LKNFASLGGVAGLAVAAVLASRGQAAERAAATPAASPMADITDVYAWMAGSNLNLVMDVSPQDDGTNAFGPAVQYVFHLTSKPGLGLTSAGGTETQVICRFASNTSVQCWVATAGTTKDYVTGDPSNTAGVTSPTGKVKIFAGRRSDPAFFNRSGFSAAIAMYQALNTGQPDAAGCPIGLQAGQGSGLRTALATGSDSLATANVMAIVVQIDKSLVNTDGNSTVAVWASTHAGT
jgi:uncharacterized protein DUF4331